MISGVIAVCRNGSFVAVCADMGWDSASAQVACNSVGFSPPFYGKLLLSVYDVQKSLHCLSVVGSAFSNANVTGSTFYNVSCNGTEFSLSQCNSSTQSNSCTALAGATCQEGNVPHI